MRRNTLIRRWRLAAALTALLGFAAPHAAHAQGFISPSFGYNFGGDAGCLTATNCNDKNWNWGGSIGALGPVVGIEGEFTYTSEFTGDTVGQTSKVTTFMGNLMLAPRISIVQPFGLVGIGAIKTKLEDNIVSSSESKTQIGWTIGGGVIVYVAKHVGLKGDIRYYHSFQALDLLGFDLGRDANKIDFGRAAFGVVFKF